MHATAIANPVPRRLAAFGLDAAALAAEVAWQVLDEVDFGLLVTTGDGRLLHANGLARRELDSRRALCASGGHVACTALAGQQALDQALRLAGAGRRQLLMLEAGDEPLTLACIPLPGSGADPLVLLMLGRRPETQTLALAFFARCHGITPAEENVLRGLCGGLSVEQVARGNGTTVGTVRTQVRCLREKTASPSIRHLLQRVAALPPVVPRALGGPAPAAAQSAA